MTAKSVSHPVRARLSDDTTPEQDGAVGLVCPRCGRRFDDNGTPAGQPRCPEDDTPLVRLADMAAADGDPMLGRVLAGRFTVLAKIGAGSMGTVYRAKQAPIGREIAIKILRSDRAIDEVSRARFLREARANSLLTSPNTVTVFDFGQSENGDFYLAMELMEGESLGQRLKRQGRLSATAAIDTARQALRSLSEAHAKGIIHRDLKPDNLFYARAPTPDDPRGEVVKVLDFGIAKMLHADAELAMNAVETQAGTVFGTPRYMSPEQAQGKTLDARSDLYSLGVILYHMLSGKPPFTDDDAIVVMARHIKTMPKPLAESAPEAKVPPEVEALVMRILSKEPDKRPQSADALITELTRVREAAGGATSGVRASVDSAALEAVASERGVPILAVAATIPLQATTAARANDSLAGAEPAGVPSGRFSRVLVVAAVLAFSALVALAIVVFTSARGPGTLSGMTAPSAARTQSPSVPAAQPSPSPPSPIPPPPPATAAPTSTIPTIAASALPRSDPAHADPAPTHTARANGGKPGGGAHPAGTASNGHYGYIE
jgi:tRNA A-37 threonylcarbamoyl transferase component Bud32